MDERRMWKEWKQLEEQSVVNEKQTGQEKDKQDRPLETWIQNIDQQRDQIYEQGRDKIHEALNLNEKQKQKLEKRRLAKENRRAQKQAFVENAYRKNSGSFAGGFSFYKLFWVFFLGCIIGVILETAFCFVTKGYIESRAGLVYGPFNPVYGFGAVLMTLGLFKLYRYRDLWIFLGSMVIGGGFEFLCSLFQELVFGTVSWEYSNTAYNLAGRTNLLFSFMWGILGLLWVKEMYPRLSRWIEKIPNKVGVPLTWVLVVFMVFNMLVSGLAVNRQKERRQEIPPSDIVDVLMDEYFPDERLKEIYPNMIVVDGTAPMEETDPYGDWGK